MFIHSVVEKDPNPTVICYELSELFSFGFWIPRCGFRITCQWNLDFGFLELNSKTLDSGIPRLEKNFQDSGMRITVRGTKQSHSWKVISLTSGTPQKPKGCGSTDLFVMVTVRRTDS